MKPCAVEQQGGRQLEEERDNEHVDQLYSLEGPGELHQANDIVSQVPAEVSQDRLQDSGRVVMRIK